MRNLLGWIYVEFGVCFLVFTGVVVCVFVLRGSTRATLTWRARVYLDCASRELGVVGCVCLIFVCLSLFEVDWLDMY